MPTSIITLISVNLFTIPYLYVTYRTDCQEFPTGILLILIFGNLCHGLDNIFYHGKPPIPTSEKNFIVFFAALLDRAIGVSTALYFAAKSFSVSFLWLQAGYLMLGAAIIYLCYTPYQDGAYWHVILHCLAMFAVNFSILGCQESVSCELCSSREHL